MVLSLLILLILLMGVTLALNFLLLLRPSNRSHENRLESLERSLERTDHTLRDEMGRNREEMTASAREAREELGQSFKAFNDSLLKYLLEMAKTTEERLEKMRSTVEERLKLLQSENAQKLNEMRVTVDEKLHATLEKRLGESFRLVSERLELVHKGLGEMQTLASGVGDLKKVLTNVKTRGILGEIQLGSLLEQILTSEQYAENISTKQGSNDRVEFAIRLPGRNDVNGHSVWLPVDAKFPREDYEKLVDAEEHGNAALAEDAARQLETRIKLEAREIKEKYLDPPHTTDFGIMFLPIEGLYAEVLRRPGLFDILQREHRVIVTGPTTLAALLNCLQMGFRTLAIQKRSSEVWTLLSAVRTEFGKFGDLLEKTQKKLQEASDTIESAAKKTRTIERRLKGVQELPTADAVQLIGEHPMEEESI